MLCEADWRLSPKPTLPRRSVYIKGVLGTLLPYSAAYSTPGIIQKNQLRLSSTSGGIIEGVGYYKRRIHWKGGTNHVIIKLDNQRAFPFFNIQLNENKNFTFNKCILVNVKILINSIFCNNNDHLNQINMMSWNSFVLIFLFAFFFCYYNINFHFFISFI